MVKSVSHSPAVRRPSRWLVVFAKLPRAGEVKTRLIPALGESGAAELYRAFLDDTVHTARQIEGVARSLWVARHPAGIRELEERYADLPVREQTEGHLGDRMHGAFRCAFAERADHVVLVGSDAPTLPAGHLRRAFEALDDAHLVLGPTEDGGYYAIGLRRQAWPQAGGVFADIAWSTPEVLAQTRRRAAALGIRHVELPVWYDVDEPHQLDRLAADVEPRSATTRVLRSVGDFAATRRLFRPGPDVSEPSRECGGIFGQGTKGVS